VQEEHQQEPPSLDLEVDVGLVLHIDPHQVEAYDQDEQQNPGNLLEDHEQEHGGHPTSGAAR